MAPRTILYTGKGGVGKTSVAAATARRCAAAGLRTVVLSTDPAHSLAESLGAAGRRRADRGRRGPVGPAGRGAGGARAQLDARCRTGWAACSRTAAWTGSRPRSSTVPPGGDELFSLLQLKRHFESGEWDAIIVDCAPTGETLRLLSFPEVAQWWLDRVLGRERSLLAAARPLARTFLDLSLPDERAFAEVQRLVRNLIAMNEILRDRAAVSLRLVMTPDRMVVAEAMRTFTYLNLYGYLTDAVVVNRVFPAEVDGYFGAWRAVQAEQLALVESGFAPVPILRAPFFEAEVVGPEMLDRLAGEIFAGHDPAALLHDSVSQELTMNGERRRAAARPAVRPQGRRVAEEDRPGADRPRRRAEAHDHAAADARAAAAGVGVVRGRRAAREVRR